VAVYLLNIIITVLLRCSRLTVSAGKRAISKKKVECFVFSFLWILISGLRGLDIGADTRAYGKDFETIVNTSWNTLWNNLLLKTSSVQSMLEGGGLNKDPGFKLLTKAVSMVLPTYRLFLIAVAVLFMVLLGRFLYKNSKDPFLGFILFDCLFYSFYAITGIRQTIATALIVLLGYEYIKERKPVCFFAVSFIAFLIHKSVLCFVPFYFVSKIRVNKITIIAAAILMVVSFVFRYQIMDILSRIMGYEQYNQQYGDGGPLMFTFLLGCVFLFCSIFRKRMAENDSDFQRKYMALVMSLLFIPLAFIDPSAMRVSYYYALFLMVLLPDVVGIFPDKSRILSTMGITVLMILFLIVNRPTYTFFFLE